MVNAHRNKKLVFAAMFNQRTDPKYVRLKRMMEDGSLGRIQRINWIVTEWFRTDEYYAAGGWRASWAGEGGGVLLNQCPHQLDLWQWLFGMPDTVQARCRFGHWHDIEVEDDVTAILEYNNGATGVFIASTGEAPGTNRLEIAADRGRVIVGRGALNSSATKFRRPNIAGAVVKNSAGRMSGISRFRPRAATARSMPVS